MNLLRKLYGFTLVELMIVMVIIGILLSLLLPGVFTGRETAIQTQCASNLRGCAIGLYAYAKDNSGDLPATLAVLESGTPQYIDNTEVFSCPKDGTAYTFDGASGDLWAMSSTDALVSCSVHSIEIQADGHVEPQ